MAETPRETLPRETLPRETWITGVGILSSLGEGPDAHWQALNAGKINVERATFAPYIVHPLAPVNFDAQIPKKGDQRMNEVRREGRALDIALAGVECLPMGFGPFAEAGQDADPGDPGLAGCFTHMPPPLGIQCAAQLRPCWCGIAGQETASL